MRLALFGIVLLSLAGCGYVGDPLPPALKIPQAVADLSAEQVGGYLEVKFTLPQQTLEGLEIKENGRVELRIAETWPDAGETVEVAPGVTNPKIPTENWAGKEVTLGLRVANPKGRFSPWSNLVRLRVEKAVAKPVNLRAETLAEGVRLHWDAAAENAEFRIHRLSNLDGVIDKEPLELGRVKERQFLDTGAEFGGTYRYTVEALVGDARSGLSEPLEITPQDKFPPAAPQGLTALNGAQSVELSWERGTEADLAFFRVYRAAPDGQWKLVADKQLTANFQDQQIKSGETWRYAISAVDRSGNESAKSNEVEINIP
jgi:hypothetical protein